MLTALTGMTDVRVRNSQKWEEGMTIFSKTRKSGSCCDEFTAAPCAVFVRRGATKPLLAIQLLWINLVTDGLPALALETDPIAPGLLTQPPRRHDAQLLNRALLVRIAWTGMLTAGVALIAFAYEFYGNDSLAQARNAAFSTLVIDELLRAFSARRTEQTIWQIGLLSNLLRR